MVILDTPRLRLRTARPDDLEAMHAVLSSVEATRYWSTPPHADLDRTRSWLQAMIDIPAGQGEDFVVEHEGRVIGKTGLYRFPEIGFILRPNSWGQGLASEALTAVLARGFDIHGLDAVIADVDPRNVASLRLLARQGFREIGRRERSWLVGNTWCDSIDLALSRPEWLAARPR